MSRCFPFPPPGYESKARTDQVDLLAKEKHKEKKRKKERKDKEKRVGTEKDKEISKDKHRDTKDRKEKYKDKKREKEKRDKGKSRTLDERRNEDDIRIEDVSRIKVRSEGHKEETLGESSQKSEEVKDSSKDFSSRIVNEEKKAAHRMFENCNGSIQRTSEFSDTGIRIGKGGANGHVMVGVVVSREQGKIDGMDFSVESNTNKKIERKEKAEDMETDDRKKDRFKDRDRGEKRSRGKDKDRHKEKEKKKEKMREKDDHKHKKDDTIKESGKNNYLDSQNLKPLALQEVSEKCIVADGDIKKRKHLEMNGFLHENERASKLPKPAPSSHPHLENGRISGSCPMATAYFFVGHESKNNIKAGVLDTKEYKINGIVGSQLSSVDPKPPVDIHTHTICEASLKPHPDSRYLRQIYNVPKMDELPESDGEWLFSSCKSRPKAKAKLENEEALQVWAEAQLVELQDVFALPYVIPY